MENFLLQKRECRRCRESKNLFDFSVGRHICKSCVNAKRRAEQHRLGADPLNKRFLTNWKA